MPNLVTVKLYLQIKVIPLSMSYAEHKSLCQLLSFKRKKRNPLNFTCLNSHCIEHIWPMAKQILNSIISETTKSYLVGNGSWSPISMLDLRPNKQTSKPGRKVPNEVPSSIEYWIEEEEEKKTRQIEMEVEKQKMSETTNWLRLRSHHTSFKSCRRFVPFCSYTMKIHTDTDSTS